MNQRAALAPLRVEVVEGPSEEALDRACAQAEARVQTIRQAHIMRQDNLDLRFVNHDFSCSQVFWRTAWAYGYAISTDRFHKIAMTYHKGDSADAKMMGLIENAKKNKAYNMKRVLQAGERHMNME